jgi:ATP-dependent RNA helicase RhlE
LQNLLLVFVPLYKKEEATFDSITQRAISVKLENRSALLQKFLKENDFSRVSL